MAQEATIGDATVLQGNKPLDWAQRAQAMEQQNRWREWQNQQALQRQRAQDFNGLMKMDFSKPGQFQRDETINEINRVKADTRNSFYQNPMASRSDIEYEIGPKRDVAERRLQKRTMFDAEFAKFQPIVKSNPQRYNMDPDAGLPAVIQQAFKDENGRNRDIDELEPEMVARVFNSPAVVNPDVRTTDAIENLKSRFAKQEMGPEQASALGFFREGVFNKARFMRPDENGNMVPGVSDELIEYVRNVDPTVPQGYLWQLAREQARGAGLDPNNMAQVEQIYNDPKFQSDNEPIVNEKIRGSLEMHQQEEHKKIIQRTGTRPKEQGYGNTDATEDDYRKVYDQIKGIQRLGTKIKEQADAIKEASGGATTDPDYAMFIKSPEVISLAQTIKSGKYNGMFVQDAVPTVEKGKPGISITVKVGTQQNPDYTKNTANEPVFVPLDDEATLFELLKNNYSEKKAKQMNWNTYEDFKNKVSGQAKKKTEADELGLN